MDEKREKDGPAAGSKKVIAHTPCDSIKLVPTDETCGGLFQTRIPPPGARTEVEWVPGVVRIVFKPEIDSGRPAAAFSDSQSVEETEEEFVELKKLLDDYGLLRYETTFSCAPPGLPLEAAPPPGRERYYTLYFPPEKDTVGISEDINKLSPIVERAAPVPQLVPPTNPTDEPLVQKSMCGVNKQWYVQRCRVDRAWNPPPPGKGVSGKGVVVADIDWGFSTSHQDLKSRIEQRYNSIDGTTRVDHGCQCSHGTAVLGILGAEASGVGMVGFAYEADLWAIQAGDETTNDPCFWVAAIDYVRRTDSQGRRKVICLEATTKTGNFNPEMDLAINKAIRDAIACDIVVCVAAGNGTHDVGLDDKGRPICETGSILVGATVFDPDATVNKRAHFSNWGERIVVSAPGDMNNDVSCSSGADNGYVNKFGGTSGATPKVAGTVALMLEANPRLSNGEIRDILRATGTHISDAESNPVGTFLNAEAAVGEARRRVGGTC